MEWRNDDSSRPSEIGTAHYWTTSGARVGHGGFSVWFGFGFSFDFGSGSLALTLDSGSFPHLVFASQHSHYS